MHFILYFRESSISCLSTSFSETSQKWFVVYLCCHSFFFFFKTLAHHTSDVEYISSMQSCDYPISFIVKCTFKCKCSFKFKMNSPSCLTGSNHKRGKLTELYMNGRTVLDTREEQGNWIMERTDQRENKTAGCMTSHATCTRQLDNGENRLEGKLDSWPMTHAPSTRTSAGKWYETSCVPAARVGWAVDCGESCNIWFVWHDILID